MNSILSETPKKHICGNCVHWHCGEITFGRCDIERKPRKYRTSKHPEGVYLIPSDLRDYREHCMRHFELKEGEK